MKKKLYGRGKCRMNIVPIIHMDTDQPNVHMMLSEPDPDSRYAGDVPFENLIRECWKKIKIAGKIGSGIFGWLGEKISNKVGSLLAKGAGKAIGPISTIASLYEFFAAYGDYAEMKLMLDRLLERAEMIAYLDVLLKKYDGIIVAQEKIIDELEEAYAVRANSKCQ